MENGKQVIFVTVVDSSGNKVRPTIHLQFSVFMKFYKCAIFKTFVIETVVVIKQSMMALSVE